MAKDDVDLEPLLGRCERSVRWLPSSAKLAGEQHLAGVRNALANPTGEDREEAIRFLLLFHEHWLKHVGGDFTYRKPEDPPALQAVRELRRRTLRDKRTRRRRAAWLGGTTLAVAAVGALFAVLAYAFPRTPEPATPPDAPGLEQPASRPAPPLPAPAVPVPPSSAPQLPPGR